jgi:hypothetical protein
MKPTPPAAAAGRRRTRGLRRLSSENISKATDETAAQVTRIGLTFFATTAFCFLSLFSPDIALLAGSEKINMPFGGPVSFSGFMLLGPAILIVLRVYLQIYVEHSVRLDRLARSMSILRASPTLLPLQNRLIRYFGALVFYLLLPLIVLFFAWKAARIPRLGLGLALHCGRGDRQPRHAAAQDVFPAGKGLDYRRCNCWHRDNYCRRDDRWF